MTIPERVWRKSSHSGTTNGDCVEVARLGGEAAVRDSKAPAAGHIRFSGLTWRGFLSAVRDR